ncbi:response regulator transcription factor [uncultured Clostridium sp.]|jgi:DNA-binding response OmpR family regulator|uniref:response regulator transcription factor n=1 Tax=uncultured Clostridium sp. TaxID=59620 RepID=UPI00262F1876|nr:response regulator transcription factor [uncultured Clostridium sp.]
MNKNILIVEDELRIRILLRDYFRKDGFAIIEASDGEEALKCFSENNIDLVILDIMMPKVNGFEVCKTIRSVSNIPIILLTAREEEEDKLHGYDLGADDYVTKPFSPKVLVAKVKALLKRTASDTINKNLSNFDGLKINKLSHEVTLDGNELSLSPKEYDLLLYLTSNKGIALSRDKILDNVWGYDYFGDIRTVDTNIKRLREKLLHKSSYITTVRGSGYKFEVKESKEIKDEI